MKVAVIGASGLIGGYLVQHLLAEPSVQHVKILVRKKLDLAHNKLEQVLVNFEDPTTLESALQGTDAVCVAVGTTQAKVKGDMAAYRKVDYDIPVNIARAAATQDCRLYLLVSSVGADANASNFYLKLKGEVEEEIKKMDLPSVNIFRPSMLLGNRAEFRLGERIGQGLMRVFNWLIPSKYKAINASDVAKAMVHCCLETNPPKWNILEYSQIMAKLK
ncbi:MAG: NAD(P)H-binding protein [Saprospiraceae bacterium]|nr:NAD(P)H-binding protein [Saprospiraceae bacterium]